jgi:peptide chain release factor 1
MKFEKLEKAAQRFSELEALLADQDIVANQEKYQKIAKEYSEITPVVHLYTEYKKCVKQSDELEVDLKDNADPELEELVKTELEDLGKQKEELLKKLDDLTNPKKQHKNRDLILEIRAGTGGDEASLFAADLYRMYTKYADKKGWKIDQMSNNVSEAGGFKEVVFGVSGNGAEKYLQFESGAHRVQRVPTTETSGRIHTSAATVAVLFEPEEVDIQIDQKDLKIDVFRSSGPGGQSVNTTDSAIRITHLPTGVVVICQDERSQLKNKYKAMRVLRARLYEHALAEHHSKETADRKLKVGSGDRSEKIRTYNFPDRRVTDHRIGFTSHKLQFVLDGDLDELMEALLKADQEDSQNE